MDVCIVDLFHVHTDRSHAWHKLYGGAITPAFHQLTLFGLDKGALEGRLGVVGFLTIGYGLYALKRWLEHKKYRMKQVSGAETIGRLIRAIIRFGLF